MGLADFVQLGPNHLRELDRRLDDVYSSCGPKVKAVLDSCRKAVADLLAFHADAPEAGGLTVHLDNPSSPQFQVLATLLNIYQSTEQSKPRMKIMLAPGGPPFVARVRIPDSAADVRRIEGETKDALAQRFRDFLGRPGRRNL